MQNFSTAYRQENKPQTLIHFQCKTYYLINFKVLLLLLISTDCISVKKTNNYFGHVPILCMQEGTYRFFVGVNPQVLLKRQILPAYSIFSILAIFSFHNLVFLSNGKCINLRVLLLLVRIAFRKNILLKFKIFCKLKKCM